MDWGEIQTAKGVTERDFSVPCNGRTVPGVLWTPEHAEAPTPLVLIGHGGSGHKREDHLVSLARRFVRHNAIAAATIDGPVHGDRKPEGAERDSVAEQRRRFIGNRVTANFDNVGKRLVNADIVDLEVIEPDAADA